MPRKSQEDLGNELKELWKEMALLTRPKCDTCVVPRSCCSPEYCEFAIAHAKKAWNEDLTRTQHPTLPLMGPDGCVAPPHVRPLCTLHVCEGTFWKAPMAWKKQYIKLREKLNDLSSILRKSTY